MRGLPAGDYPVEKKVRLSGRGSGLYGPGRIVQRNPAQPEPRPQEVNVNYSPGQRVRHKAFGEGTVLAVHGSGASAIVEIAFDNGANKKFASAFAPIDVL